mgnify:CR=1 FL=1
MTTGDKIKKSVIYILLVLLAAACLFPFLLMMVNATRDGVEITHFFTLIPSTHLKENWETVFSFFNLFRGMANSLLVAVPATLLTAYFSALTAYGLAMYRFRGIPVPGGHLYLNDVVICTAAILLDPLAAFMVGGVGAFLGDLFFYPTPMFVSLVTHGLQAVVISLFTHYTLKKRPVLASGIGVALGAVIMVMGYSLGRAFIYSTPEYAVLKLPYQILQAVVGAVAGMLLCWKLKLVQHMDRMLERRQR